MKKQSTYPHRLSALTIWALALLLVVGPLLHPAEVQASVPQIPVEQACSRSGPDYIIQECIFLAAVIDNLEESVIQQLLVRHGLPASDRTRLLTWERNLVWAALFDRLLGVIQNGNQLEAAVIASPLAAAVKNRRIAAADFALSEYNKWKANPCFYQQPAGFAPAQMCSPALTLYYGGPKPPSFEEFQAYGLAHIYGDFQNNTSLIAAAGETAKAAGAANAYTYVGGITGGALVGGVMSTQAVIVKPILKVLAPFAERAFYKFASTAGEIGGTIGRTVSATVRGATLFGGVAAIIVGAIITAVFEGIEVANAAALPGKLQDAANAARTTNLNLRQLMATEEGLSELYATFLLMTMPDYPANESLPGQESATVGFRYFTPAGSPTTQPGDGRFLYFKDWTGRNHTAWLTDGWLTDEYTDSNGVLQRRLTLDIDYINPKGEGWVAWRAGEQFLHTRLLNDIQPFGDDLITYQTPNGDTIAAQLILQLPETDLVVLGALNEGETLTFSTTYQDPQHPTSYAWSFPPDTTQIAGQTIQRTFAQSGPIAVRLDVEVQEGANPLPRLRTVTRNLLINNVPPQVENPTVTPASGDIPEGQAVTVAATFSDVAGDGPFICTASFGDSHEQIAGVINGNTCTARHSYVRKGEYKATVTVTDKDGGVGVSAESDTLTIVPSAPTITFLSFGRNPATNRIFVEGTFTDVDLDEHAVEVDWGDGRGYLQRTTLPGRTRTFRLEKSVNQHPDALGNLVRVRVYDWDELNHEAVVQTNAPAITSGGAASFGSDTVNAFTVSSSGNPPAGFDLAQGTLPTGVTFTDNGNGTATFAGSPPASASGIYQFTLRANNDTTTPALQNFTLTITDELGFTSANQATLIAEKQENFYVTTAGFPRPSELTLTGTLPAGLAFLNYTAGEAAISGQAAVGSEGVYNLTINIVDPVSKAVLVAQPFTLTILNAYEFTTIPNDNFLEEQARTFTVRVAGMPRAQLTVEGELPSGVTFVDNGNGTATLSGTPLYHTMGTYPLRFKAWRNGTVVAEQTFKLEILATRPPTITVEATTLGTATYGADSWTNGLVLVTFTGRDQGRVNCTSEPTPTTSSGGRINDASGDYYCKLMFQLETEGVHPAISVQVGGIDTGKRANASFGPIKLDLTAPETVLSSQTASSSSNEASFTFTGSDALSGLAGFACSLDGSAFTTCVSPQAYNGLALGTHTFQVRALDGAGNVDAEPATHTWTINAPPTTTPTATPVTPTVTPTATNTPIPTNTPTPTNTPITPEITPTATTTPIPTDTLIGNCGPYTIYKVGNSYTAAGWTGSIQVGTNGNNSLNGTTGPDLILGLGGNDKVDGKGGDDVICGGDGVDLLLGGAGNDLLDGGKGNDVLNGGTGDHDQLIGGEGNDTLLDGNGVINAQGGPGNDLFTLALRNGWRDTAGEAKFAGRLAAGYGNDTVVLVILDRSPFLIDVTGDERDNPASPLEGKNDGLGLMGNLSPAPIRLKFEKQLVVSAEAEAMIHEDAGAEYLTEPVGDDTAPTQANQLFLPIINR